MRPPFWTLFYLRRLLMPSPNPTRPSTPTATRKEVCGRNRPKTYLRTLSMTPIILTNLLREAVQGGQIGQGGSGCSSLALFVDPALAGRRRYPGQRARKRVRRRLVDPE